jgi:hypothetical protein
MHGRRRESHGMTMGSSPATTVDHEVDGTGPGVSDDSDAHPAGGCGRKAQVRGISGGWLQQKPAPSRDY